MTPEEIAALKAKLGVKKLIELKHPGAGSIIVKKPGKVEYQQWLDRRADPEQRTQAAKMLFIECTVQPSGNELLALLDEYPALPEAYVDTLIEMAGAVARVEKKEL